MSAPVALPAGEETVIDACDRCLALSRLTPVLCAVPVLRGTPEYEARLRAKAGAVGEGGEPRSPARLDAGLCADARELAPTPGQLVRAADGVSGKRARELEAYLAPWSADAVRQRCAETGLAATCRCSLDYPDSVRALSDPPPVLYVAGEPRHLKRCPEAAIAMVGTRRPTRVGREASRNIAMGIAQSGGIVVSGLALGVDGASHEGALSAHGVTIAVLAGGADRPSPPSHGRLYEELLERGAVVSELPPGTEPQRWSFPARNRIIAALSSAVIVVEAPLRSGALITVDHAQDLGLDVFAVPGSLASPTCEGTNRLLCDGAGGVTDGVAFMALRAPLLGTSEPAPADPAQAAVHDVLRRGARHRHELATEASSLGPGELEIALVDLELSGWIERLHDGRYRVAGRWA